MTDDKSSEQRPFFDRKRDSVGPSEKGNELSPPSKPDLSKVRLVDLAQFTQRQEQAVTPPAVKQEKAQDFGLDYECDEGERKFGADRYYGTISNKSGEPLNLYWSIACIDEPTADCIKGTNVSELRVRDDAEGKSVMEFAKGRWTIEPKGNMATSIRDRLIHDYADRSNLELDDANFMGIKPNPEGPRVMDTMTDLAVGKAIRTSIKEGNYDEVKAALEAPISPAPEIAPDNLDPASWTKEERAARVAEQVASMTTDDQAKANDQANTKGGGRTR